MFIKPIVPLFFLRTLYFLFFKQYDLCAFFIKWMPTCLCMGRCASHTRTNPNINNLCQFHIFSGEAQNQQWLIHGVGKRFFFQSLEFFSARVKSDVCFSVFNLVNSCLILTFFFSLHLVYKLVFSNLKLTPKKSRFRSALFYSHQ